MNTNILSVLQYQNLMSDADIWFLDFHDTRLPKILQLFMLLSDEEKDKANAYRQTKSRENYIITHAYLRMLLSMYCPHIHPSEWKFSIHKSGKPSLAQAHNLNLCFNLSYTYKYVAYIINSSYESGIDIEEDKQIEISDGLINLVFTKDEKVLYNHTSDKNKLFYRIWTLKEAYAKALGTDLEQAFQKIDFSDIKQIDSKKSIVFFKSKYRFSTVEILSGIWLSCCVKRKKVCYNAHTIPT